MLYGVPNRFYSKGMVPSDLWKSVKKRFSDSARLRLRRGELCSHWSVKEKDFYGNKFASMDRFENSPR